MPHEFHVEPIDAYRYRVPCDRQRGMRTDVMVYANQALMNQIRKDLSLEQAMNVATLPGIGGVAAIDTEDGVVSPGGVGFDIDCGVRLIRTTLDEMDVRPRLRDLINQIFRDVPCGAGTTGFVKIDRKQLNDVLVQGARWMVEHGYQAGIHRRRGSIDLKIEIERIHLLRKKSLSQQVDKAA
jgi:tRNA-splicing ligase RtcB